MNHGGLGLFNSNWQWAHSARTHAVARQHVLTHQAYVTGLILERDVPGSVTGNNNPRCFGSVFLQPIGLSVHDLRECACILGGNETVPKVVQCPTGCSVPCCDRKNTKSYPAHRSRSMACESEVGLARYADADGVRDIFRLVCCSTVVAVCFVVARSHQVWPVNSHKGNFI